MAATPSGTLPDHPRPTNPFVEFPLEDVGQSIPARFGRVAARHAARRAVKSGAVELTYGELDGMSDRIARAILASGGEADVPVALLLEHGPALVAALLGILKAGRIYLPLDPAYPAARSRYILDDANAGLIITNDRNLARAGELGAGALPVLNVERLPSDGGYGGELPAVSPDAPAWLLYTSGSTGRPKGVAQSHRNVLWDIREYTNTLHIAPHDRMTLLYSCSVNGSVRGIWGGLLNGASLHPLDIKTEGLHGLADLLQRERITFYHSVPSVFRSFVASLTGAERFPSLRVIRLGGERVLGRDVEAYRKHFPDGCLLYTGMGATETGHVRHQFLDHRGPPAGEVVPAGYAVEGKDVLLLDETGREVGPGEAGEIVVRSRYLALGYWRRPAETAAAFLDDPAGGSARMFRTGDLGRLGADGCLEHLGRRDFQVKVRGFRVELAEIERALLGLDAVRDAVVSAREDGAGEQRLVAYLVTESGLPLPPDLVRARLERELPEHMIPSTFVALDALPLTANGKVDRRALPAPESVSGGDAVGPRTPHEELVARIWSEVLGVGRVGVHDEFLALGGHSLHAARIVARICAECSTELSVSEVFRSGTVAELAAVLERLRKAS